MQKYGKAKNKGRSPKVCVKVGLGYDVARGTCVLGVTCRVGARGNTVSASLRHPLGIREGAQRNTARISADRRISRR